jgi:hypothetical protein
MSLLQMLQGLNAHFRKQRSGIDLKITFLDNGYVIDYDISIHRIESLKYKKAAKLYSQILQQLPNNIGAILREHNHKIDAIAPHEHSKPDSRRN